VNGRLRDVLACLDDLEDVVCEPYRHYGAGRPPRNPLGIFKALVVKRFRNIPSDRQLYRRLWSDSELRRICDIEDYEKPYYPFWMSLFKKRLGAKRLQRIMEIIAGRLRDAVVIKGEIVVVCDATFIKAYSKRDPKDDSRDYRVPDAMVGRLESLRTWLQVPFSRRYMLRTSIGRLQLIQQTEKRRIMPQNLFKKAFKASKSQTKFLIADSQYSQFVVREANLANELTEIPLFTIAKNF